MAETAQRPAMDVRLNVVVDGTLAISDVHAILLEAIRDTGSIAGARRLLGCSYSHVWRLVGAMNDTFSPQLVDVARGGPAGGGASLTNQGRKILAAFRRLEDVLREAGRAELLVINGARRSEHGPHLLGAALDAKASSG
jgi:molybdate transport system regulatory protein